MEKLELAKSCLLNIFDNEKVEDLFKFFTKDTIYYNIDKKENLSIVEMVKFIKNYQNFNVRWLESAVCVKAVLEKENENYHIYFECKRNRIIRLEFGANF